MFQKLGIYIRSSLLLLCALAMTSCTRTRAVRGSIAEYRKLYGQECPSTGKEEVRFCLLREAKAEDDQKPPPPCNPKTCLLFLSCPTPGGKFNPAACDEDLSL